MTEYRDEYSSIMAIMPFFPRFAAEQPWECQALIGRLYPDLKISIRDHFRLSDTGKSSWTWILLFHQLGQQLENAAQGARKK